MISAINNYHSPKSVQKVIDSLSTALLLLNSDNCVVYVNSAAEDLLSTSARHIEGVDVFNIFSGSEEFLNAIKQASEIGLVFTKRELTVVIPSILKTAKYDCVFSVLSEENQLLIEMSQVDQKLKMVKEENIVAQQNVLKALIKGMAHEVKNPLGGIRGAAQLLAQELDSEDLQEYTDVIIGETDRLQKLVDEMLGPNNPQNKTLVNIHKIIERVRQLVLAESKKDLQIIRDYDPSLPDILADQDHLIQAILNIVRNAKQALNGVGKIVIRTRPQRNVNIGPSFHKLVLRVSIIDDGPGVPESMLEQIFFPMVTSRADGTGLGLSIAQTLVAQHGGIIECNSAVGRTEFILLLPLNI